MLRRITLSRRAFAPTGMVVFAALLAIGAWSIAAASSRDEAPPRARAASSGPAANLPGPIREPERSLLVGVLADFGGGAIFSDSKASVPISEQAAVSAAKAYMGDFGVLGASLLTIRSGGTLNGDYWVVAMDATGVAANGTPTMSEHDFTDRDLTPYRFAMVDASKGDVPLAMEGGRPK